MPAGPPGAGGNPVNRDIKNLRRELRPPSLLQITCAVLALALILLTVLPYLWRW